MGCLYYDKENGGNSIMTERMQEALLYPVGNVPLERAYWKEDQEAKRLREHAAIPLGSPRKRRRRAPTESEPKPPSTLPK